MTRAATAGELVSLRSDGQWARWKAIIDAPTVLYTARANGSYNQIDHSIAYDGGTGTIGDCIADLTIYFGTTAGGCERAVARLRKAPAAGVFYLAPDDSLQAITNDDYITVVDDFAPFPRHPVGSLIDHDTGYTDEFTNFIPVAVMGTRYCVISAGGTADGWDASASWVPGSTITAYAWTFTGASSTTGTTTATPTATYATSGRYRVTLTVTAANSKTATTYGYVYVLGANLAAATGAIIGNVEGEYGAGWACKVTAYDRPTIYDRVRVVVYSEDYFSNTLGSLGPIAGQENIVMVGWIVGESIVRRPGYDMVEFTVGGPGVYCGRLSATSAGLVDTGYPEDGAAELSGWSKMAGLTVVKGLHYLINYRSTIARCLDVVIDDYTTPAYKLSSDSENLWAQLGDFAGVGVLTPTSDRYGTIYIQRDTRLYTYANRTANIPSIITLTDADWESDLTITRRQTGSAAMAQAEGTVYAGGEPTPIGGRSPGITPAMTGAVEQMSEVSWVSAAESLEVAGLLAGALNAEYESVSGTLPSNNHFIDVAPRQFVTLTIDGGTVRTIPRRLSLQRESESGRVSLDVDLEGEGIEWDSEAIDYPGEEEPEPGGGPSGGGSTPPEPPTPPNEPPPVESVSNYAVQCRAEQVFLTTDITVATPTWTSVKDFGESIYDSDISPLYPDLFVVVLDAEIWSTDSLTVAGTFTKVFDGATQFTDGTDLHLRRVVFASDGVKVYAIGYAAVTGGYALFLFRSTNSGATWTYTQVSTIDAPNPGFTPGAESGSDTSGVTTTITPSTYEISFSLAFDGSAAFPNTTKNIEITLDPPLPVSAAVSLSWDSEGDLPSANFDTSADKWQILVIAGGGVAGSGTPTANGYHVTATVNTSAMTLEQRTTIQVGYDGFNTARWAGLTAATRTSYFRNFTVAGEVYGSPAYALAVAPTNTSYLYVGVSDKILQSTDGGYTWTDWCTTEGAVEIQVHPTLAGAIIFVAADDHAVSQAIGGAASALGTETGVPFPGGLCYEPGSGGTIWAFNTTGDVDKRALGSWSTIYAGDLYNPLSLKAYAAGGGVYRMVAQDAFSSWYSEDSGVTWDDKGPSGDYTAGIRLLAET